MSIKILNNLIFLPDKENFSLMKKETSIIVDLIRQELKKQRIQADVFVGGSFAKGTLVKKEEYDIDIFVRFDWRYEALSFELEKIIKEISKKIKIKYETLHGSRDYFIIKKNNISFEIVPVVKIVKPKEARNVTDLSYFHVNYVRGKTKGKIANEIALAKSFCKAQGVYGAESYIKGFSGYGLECLIIYYKSFERMLRELVKVKDRIVIDPKKAYKNKDDVLINLNESKLSSPIILVDPTWKDRNVLAALSGETFKRFQESVRNFLKKPSIKFFEEKKVDFESMKHEAKKGKNEFIIINLETNKQAGDIAGTKMKKFANFLTLELGKYFNVIKSEFEYDEGQKAKQAFILKSKKEIIKVGPPTNMKDSCKAFRKANKGVFEKSGMLHAKIKINYSAKRFLQGYIKKYAKKLKEMDITKIVVD